MTNIRYYLIVSYFLLYLNCFIKSHHTENIRRNTTSMLSTENEEIKFPYKYNLSNYASPKQYVRSLKDVQAFFKKQSHRTLFFYLYSKYLNYYTAVIIFLLLLCIFFSLYLHEAYKINQELKRQIQKFKERDTYESTSAKSTRSENTDENDKVLPGMEPQLSKYLVKDNFEDDYDQKSHNWDLNKKDKDLYNAENKSVCSHYSHSNEFKNYKMKVIENEDTSRKSIHSALSVCRSEEIKSVRDFDEKDKSPFLQEAFKLNIEKSDVQSSTECIVEETDNLVKKTELRKIVTIYNKKPSNASDKEIHGNILSMKINVSAELTKDNLKLCYQTSDMNEENINLNTLEKSIQFGSLQLSSSNISGTCNSNKIFPLNESYKEELKFLSQKYLLSAKENFSLEKNSGSVLNMVSLHRKHNEIIKLIDSEKNSVNYENSSNDYTELFEKFDTGRFVKNFDEISIIGKGGFGSVFKARHKIDQNDYAIKIIKLNIQKDEKLCDQEVVKEIKTMMKLHSENIVRYITCWFEQADYLKNSKVRSKSSNKNNITLNMKSLKTNSQQNIFINNSSESLISLSQESFLVHKNDASPSDKKTSQNKLIDNWSILYSKNKEKNFRNKEKTMPVYFYMQIEYCKGFPLSFYLENRVIQTKSSLIFYMFKQVLEALDHIHHHNIIHRDLK
jgi:hypothetical protein